MRGRRDLAELGGLLGPDAADLVRRLVRDGYLAVPTPAAPASPAAPSPGHAPQPPRRSLVAAKVYLSGMLELQRDDGARAHRARLQARQDDEALLENLADALRFLERRVAATLAGRIRERLLEALPEHDLPRMRERLDSRDAVAAP